MGPRLFPRDSEYGEEDPDVGVKLPDHFFVFFFKKRSFLPYPDFKYLLFYFIF